jgi:biopolymer transport protein ExbD
MDFIRPKRSSMRMDLAPLIDVVFQLLIFFMLTSSFMNPALRLQLPRAATHERIEPDQLVVSIDESGAIYVNFERVSMDNLGAVLQQKLAASDKKQVNFRGDANLPYKIFVKVMDIAKQAGAKQFNLVHEHEGK